MRSADQIKRKWNELLAQKQQLENHLNTTDDEAAKSSLRLQIERVEESALLLEWVLNAPSGSYHA